MVWENTIPKIKGKKMYELELEEEYINKGSLLFHIFRDPDQKLLKTNFYFSKAKNKLTHISNEIKLKLFLNPK